MDFDDLDGVESGLGPTPEERRQTLLGDAKPEPRPQHLAQGKSFAPTGKLKMVYAHGGTNAKMARHQILNLFQHIPDWKGMMEFDVFEGVHHRSLSQWSPPMQEALKPYGPDFYLYYDHALGSAGPGLDPHGILGVHNQTAEWPGLDAGLDAFAEFLRKNGPYDGWVGFDQGSHLMMHAARRAQDGDKAFEGALRFMVLFAGAVNRPLSSLGPTRPKAPLQIPTFYSFSRRDDLQAFPISEEGLLFLEEGMREVAVYPEEQHKPPRLTADMDAAGQLHGFIRRMASGRPPAPPGSPEGALYSGLWLPLVRAPAPALPPGRRRLLVIPDPAGGGDVRSWLEGLEQSHPLYHAWKLRAELYLDVACVGAADFRAAAADDGELTVEALEHPATGGASFFQPRANVPSITLDPQDIIHEGPAEHDASYTALARRLAAEFMGGFALSAEDQVGIVGIGAGAFVGLMVAREMITGRRAVPAGFWAVCPPRVLPAETLESGPGMLVDCPLWYMVSETSRAVAPWRWELQTLGPFAECLYKDRAAMVATVVGEFKRR